jgi:uncharacterized protein
MTGKHATEEFRRIAEDGTILRCQVGSGLHGISVSGQDDRDEMGICIEPPSYVIGVRSFDPHTIANPGDLFRQYEWHSAWERGGVHVPSGPGDLDITIYSLGKWARLALAANPTILLPLFAPESECTILTPLGRELREIAPAFISRRAADTFAGYLDRQRDNLLSHDGKGRDVTRPELIRRYGWDVKYGGHMIRLGLQGVELLQTGRITLPMPADQRELVRSVRLGQRTMRQALGIAEDLSNQLAALARRSPLPGEPDRERVDQWLVSAYQRKWKW